VSEYSESNGEGMSETGVWHVYILQCRDGAYYIGITNDLARRWSEHSTGRGGHYTKCNPPVRLVFKELHASRSSAAAREKQLKGWTRRKKEAMIAGELVLLKNL
jgi:predicted GIY-YIG superfamily endonuclease